MKRKRAIVNKIEKDLTLLNDYESVLKQLSTHKSKANLVELDKEYQNLSLELRKMKHPYLTKEQLKQVVEWKLARGKFRPTLMKWILSNDSHMIENTTRKGFELDFPESLKKCCELKGVGPATATGKSSFQD